MVEDTRDGRDQLFSAQHQRIDGVVLRLLLLLLYIEQSLRGGHTLAAQNHGAYGKALDLLVEVRDGEVGLVGSNASCLIVASEELDQVLAGQQRETGIVLDRATSQLLCC